MPTDDFNPYAPPLQNTAFAVADRPSTDAGYRIEKNVMILPPPFVLPEVCFLTGTRHGLQRCEIPLKVMPKWWHYVMPAMMFSLQMIVMFGGIAVQRLKLLTSPLFVPPLVGLVMGITAPVTIVLGVFFVAKKISLTGFRESSDSVFTRRRRFFARVLIFDVILGAFIAMTQLMMPPAFLLTGLTLVSVSIAFLVTLVVWQKNRRPWSRIGALQQADGSLAVYGLDPSFLAVCRLGLDDCAAPSTTQRFT